MPPVQLPFNHPLNSVRWFHANVSGAVAERLLREGGKDGSFLVRPSASHNGAYTITCRILQDKFIHMLVKRSKKGMYTVDGCNKFATVVELLEYHMENPDKSERFPVTLSFPLHSNDPTMERWYHGKMSAKEAEKILKARGKNGHFLVRESQTKPGNFVLSVCLTKQVEHILIVHKDGKYDLGNPRERFNSLTELIERYSQISLARGTDVTINLRRAYKATRFSASCIAQRIEDLECIASSDPEAKSGFWEEFEQLQHELSSLQSRNEAQRTENKPKNRFKNILPYDYSRVILTDRNKKQLPLGSNYINANYIRFTQEDENGKKPAMKTYIATQGCLGDTIGDFWYMIWQEKCRIIVMTTKLVERGKNKCMRYWPDPNEPIVERNTPDSGKILIERKDEEAKGDYILRSFILTKFESDGAKLEPSCIVYQFHFTAWPDKQVPRDPAPIINFSHAVDKKYKELAPTGPVTVHCSAGIGRTGTLITINMLINQLRRQGFQSDIDIQKTVSMVRSQRSGMVQTEAQYKFVFVAIKTFLAQESPYAAVPVREADPGPIYGNVPMPHKPPNKVKPPPPVRK